MDFIQIDIEEDTYEDLLREVENLSKREEETKKSIGIQVDGVKRSRSVGVQIGKEEVERIEEKTIEAKCFKRIRVKGKPYVGKASQVDFPGKIKICEEKEIQINIDEEERKRKRETEVFRNYVKKYKKEIEMKDKLINEKTNEKFFKYIENFISYTRKEFKRNYEEVSEKCANFKS